MEVEDEAPLVQDIKDIPLTQGKKRRRSNNPNFTPINTGIDIDISGSNEESAKRSKTHCETEVKEAIYKVETQALAAEQEKQRVQEELEALEAGASNVLNFFNNKQYTIGEINYNNILILKKDFFRNISFENSNLNELANFTNILTLSDEDKYFVNITAPECLSKSYVPL